MVPFAMLVGARADPGPQRFFLAALLILPIRGALYTFSDNPFWLVGGSPRRRGAGISAPLFPVIVADLMRNTGRFNVAQGAIITAQSIARRCRRVGGAGRGWRRLQRGVSHATARCGSARPSALVAFPETRTNRRWSTRAQGRPAPAASAIAAE